MRLAKNVKPKIANFFKCHEYRNFYIIIGLILVGSYYFVREFITDQDAWSIIMVAPLTINMLLCFFLWGVYAERKWKVQPQWKRLAFDFLGFIVISVIFRFGFGMKSILG